MGSSVGGASAGAGSAGGAASAGGASGAGAGEGSGAGGGAGSSFFTALTPFLIGATLAGMVFHRKKTPCKSVTASTASLKTDSRGLYSANWLRPPARLKGKRGRARVLNGA